MRTEIIEILQSKYPEYCMQHIDTADEILRLFNGSQQRELFVKEQGKWLMVKTNLSVEQIIDFKMEFINK